MTRVLVGIYLYFLSFFVPSDVACISCITLRIYRQTDKCILTLHKEHVVFT